MIKECDWNKGKLKEGGTIQERRNPAMQNESLYSERYWKVLGESEVLEAKEEKISRNLKMSNTGVIKMILWKGQTMPNARKVQYS